MSNPCYSAGTGPIHPAAPVQYQLIAELAPAARITSAGSTLGGVDRASFGNAIVLVQTGVTSGSPDSFTVVGKLQSASSINGSYSDVVGSSVTVSAVSTSGQVSVSLAGAKQYVRFVLIPTLVNGTSPTIICSGALLLAA